MVSEPSSLVFGLTTLKLSFVGYICVAFFIHILVFMTFHDSSVKFSPKFDVLNFPVLKVKMTLFLKSLGVRVAKAISKEFVERHKDEETWS